MKKMQNQKKIKDMKIHAIAKILDNFSLFFKNKINIGINIFQYEINSYS